VWISTCYKHNTNIDWAQKDDCVYYVGVDPAWFLADNELTFINNMKMKISVIFGVTQMSLGIFMKAFNSVHFRKPLDFLFEFIPQIILLSALFGWMNLLIIVKWLTPWTTITSEKAPGIITIMIQMFLSFGKVDKDKDQAIIFNASTQQLISIILLVTALICMPLMLCGKKIQ